MQRSILKSAFLQKTCCLTDFPVSRPYLPMGIHIPSTACDVISFNGQGQLCVPTELVQSEEIFQTIPEWAQFSQGHQRKPCNIALKISMKILFHYPPPVLLKSKFTVTWVSILKTQDSILETFKDRVLSLDDRGLRISFKFRVENLSWKNTL